MDIKIYVSEDSLFDGWGTEGISVLVSMQKHADQLKEEIGEFYPEANIEVIYPTDHSTIKVGGREIEDDPNLENVVIHEIQDFVGKLYEEFERWVVYIAVNGEYRCPNCMEHYTMFSPIHWYEIEWVGCNAEDGCGEEFYVYPVAE